MGGGEGGGEEGGGGGSGRMGRVGGGRGCGQRGKEWEVEEGIRGGGREKEQLFEKGEIENEEGKTVGKGRGVGRTEWGTEGEEGRK